MNDNIIPVDIDRDRMRDLPKKLSLERLDIEGAKELKQLLQKESSTMDLRYRKTLLRLIEILDKYISGNVNLLLRGF